MDDCLAFCNFPPFGKEDILDDPDLLVDVYVGRELVNSD
jgi:hypothetical protein